MCTCGSTQCFALRGVSERAALSFLVWIQHVSWPWNALSPDVAACSICGKTHCHKAHCMLWGIVWACLNSDSVHYLSGSNRTIWSGQLQQWLRPSPVWGVYWCPAWPHGHYTVPYSDTGPALPSTLCLPQWHAWNRCLCPGEWAGKCKAWMSQMYI